MSERTSPPIWYWIVAALALIWNAMGVMAYIGQVYMTPEAMEALSQQQQDYYGNMPVWVTAAFAIAVFGGTLGCLLLLLRKSLAIMILTLSLVAIIIQSSYNLFIAEFTDGYGPGQIVMTIMIPLIAVLLIWLAKSAKTKGWTA